MLEKIVHKRMMNYLKPNGILNIHQGGFREGHSTIKTVADFTDDIFLAMNNSMCTIATFVDFRKAFDTVNHSILLKKCNLLGISGTLSKWLESYLNQRKQCTVANGCMSKEREIVCGVPQGSILGPLLFLLYINDIDYKLHNCGIKLYADDTVLYVSADRLVDACNKLQSNLEELAQWCTLNRLSINVKKTKCMVFGSRRFTKITNLPFLKLGSDTLHYAHNYKYLGVILDRELNFQLHLKNIYQLASHKVYVLSLLRAYLTQEAALILYKSKILPYFDYGDIFYHGTHNYLAEKLQKLQNRALRICIHAPPRSSRDFLHYTTNIPFLAYRRRAHLRNFMFTRKDNQNYIDLRNISTRIHNAVVFINIRANLTCFERSILWKGAREWNNLETAVRQLESRDSFKVIQKRWMQSTIPIPRIE